MINDNCCVCNKPLFDERGKRLDSPIYQIGIVRKIIMDCGWNEDSSECCAYICKKCFTKKNNEKIMETLWSGHRHMNKVRRQKDDTETT